LHFLIFCEGSPMFLNDSRHTRNIKDSRKLGMENLP
jgi:hypothetical protein